MSLLVEKLSPYKWHITFGSTIIVAGLFYRSRQNQNRIKNSPTDNENEPFVIEIIHNKKKRSVFEEIVCVDNSNNSVDDILVERLLAIFREIKQDRPIDIIIHTNGGLCSSTKIIVDILNNHNGRKRIFIPEKAYSAGTMIVLACDEIYMNKNAHLSPIDPQIYIGLCNFPVQAFKKLFQTKESQEIGDLVHLFNNTCEKSQHTIEQIYETCIKPKYSKETYNNIYQNLVEGAIKSHDYCFNVNELKEMGLDINTTIPSHIMERFQKAKQV